MPGATSVVVTTLLGLAPPAAAARDEAPTAVPANAAETTEIRRILTTIPTFPQLRTWGPLRVRSSRAARWCPVEPLWYDVGPPRGDGSPRTDPTPALLLSGRITSRRAPMYRKSLARQLVFVSAVGWAAVMGCFGQVGDGGPFGGAGTGDTSGSAGTTGAGNASGTGATSGGAGTTETAGTTGMSGSAGATGTAGRGG